MYKEDTGLICRYNDLLAHRIPRISWVHFARAIHARTNANNYCGDFTVT